MEPTKQLYRIDLEMTKLPFNIIRGNKLYLKPYQPILPVVVRSLQIKKHGLLTYAIVWVMEFFTRLVETRNVKKAIHTHKFESEVIQSNFDTAKHNKFFQRYLNRNCDLRYEDEAFAILNEELTLMDIVESIGEMSDADLDAAIEKADLEHEDE